MVLGTSEGGLSGQDAAGGFPASGRNAYPSGANPFFADALECSPALLLPLYWLLPMLLYCFLGAVYVILGELNEFNV